MSARMESCTVNDKNFSSSDLVRRYMIYDNAAFSCHLSDSILLLPHFTKYFKADQNATPAIQRGFLK